MARDPSVTPMPDEFTGMDKIDGNASLLCMKT
jgi:hypothetical protein